MYKVVLDSVESKVAAMKALATIPGITEDDAMNIILDLPAIVKEVDNEKAAEFIVDLLAEVGCEASAVPSESYEEDTVDSLDEVDIPENEAPEEEGMSSQDMSAMLEATALYNSASSSYKAARVMYIIATVFFIGGFFVEPLLIVGGLFYLIGWLIGRSGDKKSQKAESIDPTK